jgi:hypothetical protein
MCSFNTYFLGTCYVQDPMFGAAENSIKETKSLSLLNLY